MRSLFGRFSGGLTLLAATSLGAALLTSACGGDDDGDGGGEGGEGGAVSASGGSGSGSGGADGSGGGGVTPESLVEGVPGASARFLEGFPKVIAGQGDKLLVAGTLDRDFWITRLDASGEIDASFGDGGSVVVPFPAGNSNPLAALDFDIVFGLTVTDDAIYAAGSTRGFAGVTDARFALIKLSLDGELDTSFGRPEEEGLVVLDWTRSSFASSVRVAPDGKLYLVGTLENASSDIALARLNADGTVDSSFSLAGSDVGAVVSNGRSEQAQVSILTEDRLILGGGSDFRVAGLTLSGPYDDTFGTEGWSLHDGGELAAGALTSDGTLFFAGLAPRDGDRVDALRFLRLNQDGSPVDGFGTNGVVDARYDFGDYVLDESLGGAWQDSFVQVHGFSPLEDGGALVYADSLGFLVRYSALVRVNASGELVSDFGQGGLIAFPVALPLFSGAGGNPAHRLYVRGSDAWFVEEAVLTGGNRGVLIHVDLDAL